MTPAIAARRFSPPESSNGDFSSRDGFRSVNRAASFARSIASSSESPMFFGPNMMSFRTVSSKSWYSGYWNTMPT